MRTFLLFLVCLRLLVGSAWAMPTPVPWAQSAPAPTSLHHAAPSLASCHSRVHEAHEEGEAAASPASLLVTAHCHSCCVMGTMPTHTLWLPTTAQLPVPRLSVQLPSLWCTSPELRPPI